MSEKGSEAYEWIQRSEKRKRVVCIMTQPLTATQLVKRCGYSADACMVILRGLAKNGVVNCLNADALQNRLYWLTEYGKLLQARLNREVGKETPSHDVPEIDWSQYAFVCFEHRAAIIKALEEPLQPATIKKRARSRDPELRMSSNNTRDAIRLLLHRGIVRQVRVRKRAHPRYELTDECREFPRLLRQAMWRGAQ
jgi:predicted transcriptional regulator